MNIPKHSEAEGLIPSKIDLGAIRARDAATLDRHIAGEEAAPWKRVLLDRRELLGELERLTQQRESLRSTVLQTEAMTARLERIARGRVEEECERLRAELTTIAAGADTWASARASLALSGCSASETTTVHPNTSNLQRYGIRWNGPRDPIGVPMANGYWTPWHEAQAEIERLREVLQRTRHWLVNSQANVLVGTGGDKAALLGDVDRALAG